MAIWLHDTMHVTPAMACIWKLYGQNDYTMTILSPTFLLTRLVFVSWYDHSSVQWNGSTCTNWNAMLCTDSSNIRGNFLGSATLFSPIELETFLWKKHNTLAKKTAKIIARMIKVTRGNLPLHIFLRTSLSSFLPPLLHLNLLSCTSNKASDVLWILKYLQCFPS